MYFILPFCTPAGVCLQPGQVKSYILGWGGPLRVECLMKASGPWPLSRSVSLPGISRPSPGHPGPFPDVLMRLASFKNDFFFSGLLSDTTSLDSNLIGLNRSTPCRWVVAVGSVAWP